MEEKITTQIRLQPSTLVTLEIRAYQLNVPLSVLISEYLDIASSVLIATNIVKKGQPL